MQTVQFQQMNHNLKKRNMERIKLISEKIKKNYFVVIPYILSIVVIVLLVLTIDKSNGIILENVVLKEQKNSLQKESIKHVVRQKELEIKFETQSIELVKLKTELKQAKLQYINLKTKYNEKINDINTYSVSDLQRFFTNRYKQNYPIE